MGNPHTACFAGARPTVNKLYSYPSKSATQQCRKQMNPLSFHLKIYYPLHYKPPYCGSECGSRQKRRWDLSSAVSVYLTHIEKTKWVTRSKLRTINTEKPPFLAVFPVFWSEMGDSNSRHPAPKAGALPTALIPVI